MDRNRRHAGRLVASLLLAVSAVMAVAGIDTFLVVHRPGPCG